MLLFLLSISHSFLSLSLNTVYQELTSIACIYKLIFFDLAILCLICAEDKGIVFLLSGIAFLLSADFLFNYSSIAKISHILVYGEFFWLLGVLFMYLGLLFIYQNESFDIHRCFRQTNAIKSRLIFWTFGISIISFVLFFIVTYAFSLIGKFIFSTLPFFLMTYSVLVAVSYTHLRAHET